MAGCVVHSQGNPGKVDEFLVSQKADIVWFGQLKGVFRHGQELLASREETAASRIGEAVSIIGVDVGGDGEISTDWRNGPHMINVPVRQQHRGRGKSVFPHLLGNPRTTSLPWVDNEARFTGCGGNDVTIR
jgi:hypothetical protein